MNQPQKFENRLIGQRVRITSSDWQRQITGTLVKVERYVLVVRLDSGGTTALYKHAISAVVPIRAKGEEDSEEA